MLVDRRQRLAVAAQITEVQPHTRGDHRRCPAGDLRPIHPAQEDRHQQRRHLLVGHPPVGVAVDHPVDRGIGEPAAVALGPDDRRSVVATRHWAARIECELGHDFSRRTRSRSAGPKASGRRSPSALGPSAWSTSNCGPPCSARSCRHRPQGISAVPVASTTATATNRPHPRKSGHRPPRTRHRDLRHMRHFPHCSPQRPVHRRPARPPRRELGIGCIGMLAHSNCLMPQGFPVDIYRHVRLATAVSECIPSCWPQPVPEDFSHHNVILRTL